MGRGPDFPMSLSQGIGICLCALAGSWETASAAPAGFCGTEARGMGR